MNMNDEESDSEQIDNCLPNRRSPDGRRTRMCSSPPYSAGQLFRIRSAVVRSTYLFPWLYRCSDLLQVKCTFHDGLSCIRPLPGAWKDLRPGRDTPGATGRILDAATGQTWRGRGHVRDIERIAGDKSGQGFPLRFTSRRQ